MNKDIFILILRLCLGVFSFIHGAEEIFGWFNGPGMQAFADVLSKIGLKNSLFWAYIGAYLKLIIGMSFISGVFLRSSAFIYLLVSPIAIFVHWKKGFFAANGGFEMNFVLACLSMILLILGSGKYRISFSSNIFKK